MLQLKFKIYTIINFILIPIFVFGQNEFSSFFYDTLQHHSYQFYISANIDYQTMRIRNNFTDKLIFGGHIDYELKQKTLNNLYSNNNFGGKIRGDLRFRDFKTKLFKKLPRIGYEVSYTYNVLMGGLYSKDFFELALFGNKGSVERKFDLKNLDINLINFHQFSFGFFDKKTKSSVSLSYIHGVNFLDASIQNSSLKTEDSTYNLTLDLDGQIIQSKNNHLFLKPNGWGLALNGNFIFPSKWFNGKKAYFKIEINNFGFIRWNSKTQITEKDSIYQFNGIEAKKIGKFTEIISNFSSLNELLNITKTNRIVTNFLPTYLAFSKIFDTHNPSKIQSIFGLKMLFIEGFLPMVHIGFIYKPVKWFYGGVLIEYGGFGQLRAGIQFNFIAKEKYAFHLSTNDLLGLVTTFGNGRSLQVGIKLDI